MSTTSFELNVLYARYNSSSEEFDATVRLDSSINVGALKSIVISSLRNKLSGEISALPTEKLDAVLVFGQVGYDSKKQVDRLKVELTTEALKDTDSVLCLQLDKYHVLRVKEIFERVSDGSNTAQIAEVTLTPKELPREKGMCELCLCSICEWVCCWVESEVDNKLENSSNNVRGAYGK